MNKRHARLCASAEWAEYLQGDVLAPLLHDHDLGRRVIEAGPGYGATTEWLLGRVEELVAVETDPERVSDLRNRFAGTHVEVVEGDAGDLPFRNASFDSAVTCTMLHHVPTRAHQRRVIGELVRVVRRGGVIAGSDSLASAGLRNFHEGDTYNPLPPEKLLAWFAEFRCRPIHVTVGDVMTFVAVRTGRIR